MIRIDTQRIVALVTNQHPFGDLAYMDDVRKTMCGNYISAIPEGSVLDPKTQRGCFPVPTIVRTSLCKFLPELENSFFSAVFCHHREFSTRIGAV